MKQDLVLIEWEDHFGGVGGWKDVAEMADWSKDEYLIKTVGFVVSQSKDRICVVQNYACNDMANHMMTIMKKNIRFIKILKKGK